MDFLDQENHYLEEKIAAEEILFKEAFNGYDKSVQWRSIVTVEPVVDFIVA